MAIRVYLIPETGTGAELPMPVGDPLRPKYLQEAGITPRWALRYGAQSTYLVAADVTPTQHSAIAANADVTALPQDLTTQVGANLATVQATLESLQLPGSWVQATHTFRFVVRTVAAVMILAQRFAGLFDRLSWFASSITLDTTMAQLTAAQRTRLQRLADSFGIDSSSATGSTTVRQVLLAFAPQLPPVVFARDAF